MPNEHDDRTLSSLDLDAVIGCGYVETDVQSQPTLANRARRMFDDASAAFTRNWDDGWQILGYDTPSRYPSNVEPPQTGPSLVGRAYNGWRSAVGVVQENYDDAWRIAGYDMPSRYPSNVEPPQTGPSLVERAYGPARTAYEAVSNATYDLYSAGARAVEQLTPSSASNAPSPPLVDADPQVLEPPRAQEDANQFVGGLEVPYSDVGGEPTDLA